MIPHGNHRRLHLKSSGTWAAIVISMLHCATAASSAEPPKGVVAFVRDHHLTRYTLALVNLTNDRKPAALIYAMANADGGGEANLCGSGGCELYVLTLTPTGYRQVTNISITRPPIRILPTITHGWHDLGVLVAGGGINPGYEAQLRFDGRTYPSNPTVPPATRLKTTAGKQVIGEVPTLPIQANPGAGMAPDTYVATKPSGGVPSHCSFSQPAKEYSSLDELPEVAAEFRRQKLIMAKSGEPFQIGDNITRPDLRTRQFIRAYVFKDSTIVWYYRRGFVTNFHIVQLRMLPNDRKGVSPALRLTGRALTGPPCAATEAILAGVDGQQGW